jgi:hypothetical protein
LFIYNTKGGIMKIHLYYKGKRSVKKEIITAKSSKEIIRKVKKICKKLDLTHVQTKTNPFINTIPAYHPFYNVKPLPRISKADLETEHLAAYNFHRDINHN